MTLNEKIIDIRKKLILSNEQFSKLINVPQSIIKKIESGCLYLNTEQIENIAHIFNFETEILTDEKQELPLLSFKEKFDSKNYKNQFSVYSEILKKCFRSPCKIFVLAKTKRKNKLESILDIFFKNSKNSIINEMKSFNPTYLIKNDNYEILVSINQEEIEVYELNANIEKNRFSFGQYNYVIANEIKIK